MEINDFAAKVCAAVKEELGRKYKAEVKEVRKNNGILLHGLLISSKEQNVVPTIYLESFWEAYESGLSFEEVIRRLLCVYQRDTPQGIVDMEFFRHYEKVKDRVCFRLIGRSGNEELLKEIPYIEFLDMAVCFYYAYQGEGLGDGSILIYHSHIKMWGVCTEDLFRQAQVNTPKLFPCECTALDEVLKEITGDDLFDREPSMPEPFPMKVLSNRQKVHGASSILYPGVLERLAANEGCNFYILPSSIHEVLLLPDKEEISADELKQMIFVVNSTQIAPDEVLTDSLYYYDVIKKEVVIV